MEVFDKDTNERKTYASILKVAYRFGIGRTTVRSYITSGKSYKDRYYFKYFYSNK